MSTYTFSKWSASAPPPPETLTLIRRDCINKTMSTYTFSKWSASAPPPPETLTLIRRDCINKTMSTYTFSKWSASAPPPPETLTLIRRDCINKTISTYTFSKWGWAAHFWDNWKRPCLPTSAQKISCLFLSLATCFSNIMVSTTQTVSQMKSQEIIGHIKQHFMTTSPLTYVTNGIQDFVKCCIKRWVHLDLQHTTCFLVVYILYTRTLTTLKNITAATFEQAKHTRIH